MNNKWRIDEPPKDKPILGQYQIADSWDALCLYWWNESEQGWVCKEENIINYLPPDRWQEPPSETELMLNQVLTTLTTIADLAETLPRITKQLFDLNLSSIYEVSDARFYHDLYKQWSRANNSILDIQFSEFCQVGSEFHDAKARFEEKQRLHKSLMET